MKRLFNFLPSDQIIIWGFSISIVPLIVSLIAVGIFFNFLPPFVPIYNKMPWGYARVGTKIELFIPIGIGIFFYFANLVLSSFFYKKIVLLGRFFSAVTFAVSLTTLIFVIQIILLVR